MDKEKVSVNDVLEALAIRTNDVLRPDKKSKNKKNNAYFWLFKLIYLLLLVFLIKIVFDSFEDIGVSLIYGIAKSLRSVLSIIWVSSLSFIKGILILCLFYDNLKIFTGSEYYKNLYESNKEMFHKKEEASYIVELLLKVFSIFYMVSIAILGLCVLFILAILIFMLFKGIYMISPLIIFVSIFLISFFTFLHIKNKFFGKKQYILKGHFIFAFVVLIIGVIFLGYETSSYEYVNKLPDDMKLTIKEKSFDLEDDKKIILKSESKLNNLKVIYDDTLEDEMIVRLEYYKTADVRYSYEFNDKDDLNLTFMSKLDVDPITVNDLLNVLYSTFNRKTIYNYNLFKYPNIYVFINSKYENQLIVK